MAHGDRATMHDGVEQFLDLFAGFHAAIIEFNANATVVGINDHFCELIGRSQDEILGAEPPFPWWPEDQWAWFAAQLGERLERAAERGKFSGEFQRGDGTRLEVVGGTSVLVGERGERLAMALRDAAALRRAVRALVGESLAASSSEPDLEVQLRRLFDSNIIGIISGEDDRILRANDAFLGTIGYTREDFAAHGIDWPNLTPPEWRAVDAEAGTTMFRTGAAGPIEKQYLHRDGHRVWVRIAGAVTSWEPFRWVSFVEDVTAARMADAERSRLLAELRTVNAQLGEANQRLEHLAYVDHLTGLPNRNMLTRALEQALARARRHGTLVGVLMVDLDHFKEVNDTYGHAAGDQLLREFGKALRGVTRQDDTAGRWGGDEFLMITELVEHQSDAEAAAERVVELGRRSYPVDGHEVTTNASIGVVVCSGDEEPDNVLHRADRMLYEAKAAGGDRHAADDGTG